MLVTSNQRISLKTEIWFIHLVSSALSRSPAARPQFTHSGDEKIS